MSDQPRSPEQPEGTSSDQNDKPEAIIRGQKAVSDAVISAVQKTDETMLRLNRLLSSKAGLDITLSTLNYSSHALHYLLAASPLAKLRLVVRQWLLTRLGRDVSKVPPSAASISGQSRQPPLLAFSDLISKTRYTIRLLGLVSLWSWGSSTYKSPPKDPVLRLIAYSEVLSLVVYQALENVTYLASNGVIDQKLLKRTGGIGRWSLWSIRAWFGYILLQFVRLARESILFTRQEEEREKHRAEQISASEKSISQVNLAEDAAVLDAARKAEIRNWRKRLVNNLAWAPLCAHWSFEKGIGVPSSLTGFISLLAGIWGTYDAWQATAMP